MRYSRQNEGCIQCPWKGRVLQSLVLMCVWLRHASISYVVTATENAYVPKGEEDYFSHAGDPFFIVSTVDGSIGVLNALDGSLVSAFPSGIPLVVPSKVMTGGWRIVPGLDGGLFLSQEEKDGVMHALEVTVLDILETPTKICSGVTTKCGIVTATQSTSRFALDALSGRLIWKQSPNGTTIIEDSPDDVPVLSTVLLQREDVFVQHMSAETGECLWNATLGTVQAFEFGDVLGESHDSITPDTGGSFLPSAVSHKGKQLFARGGVHKMGLPQVYFGPDGQSLMAVTENENGDSYVLWSREFPTVVASVFGLQDGAWKPLTVLDDIVLHSDGSNFLEKPMMGSDRNPKSLLAVYQPPALKHLFQYWSEPTSLLDRLADAWMYATGQQGQFSGQDRYRRVDTWASPNPPKMLVPRKVALAPLLPRDDLFAPPRRLTLPSSPHMENSISTSGIYLTWRILVILCLCVVGLATLVFRYLYLQKKSKWIDLINQTVQNGLTGNNAASKEDMSDQHALDKALGTMKRSQSLPDVTAGTENINTQINRRLRSESLQISHTFDGDVAYEKEVKEQTSSTASKITDNNIPREDQPQAQGVGFLVDGIPLIRYNRYDSEFTEVVALGKGGFGTVFRCQNVLDGREYAIKKVALKYKEDLPIEDFRQRLQRTLREVKSLALLDHPNIVRYYTAWLELQQPGEKGELRRGNSDADSDYYLFSPSNTQTNAQHSATKILSREKQSCMTDNPLGGWNTLDESTRSKRAFYPFQAGIPDKLDDYGFTFDRSDEQADELENSVVPQNEASINGDGKSKILDFAPEGPIIHRYSDNMSVGSDSDSSIEGSYSDFGGGLWSSQSQSERQESQAEAKTEELLSLPLSNGSIKPLSKGTVRHILYIQMQFCSQKTLADFLSNPEMRRGGETENGRVDIPYALSLFLQISQGVEHVHSQGLIHRDLKPNNCFIDDSGAVKVGDFGLSRESANETRDHLELVDELIEERDSPIDENNFHEITAGVGTRSYASPEQMKGSDYDSSTDIYSLGIMLFELCYPMYTGMERTIVLTKLRDHIFPEQWINSIKPAFPSLHSLLQNMISSRPNDRPTATVVASNIQTILEGFTISSIDKRHHEDATLLRVEAKPREDVLRHTMNLVKGAASPDEIEILQYGLRGGTTKAVMEFAISSITCPDRGILGNKVVTGLEKCDEILLIRQVSGTKYTYN